LFTGLLFKSYSTLLTDLTELGATFAFMSLWRIYTMSQLK